MKNLSNCKPTEFFAQTVKIRKYAENWLNITELFSIRKTTPVFTENMTDEEKKRAMAEQAKANLWRMFDKVFEENAELTIGLLALLCFIEPEDADNHEVGEYLESISELISDERVLSFFTSLARLDRKSILNSAKI